VTLLEKFIGNLFLWIINNPWIFITSIMLNVITAFKALLNYSSKRRYGQASLAAKRLHVLLIPLNKELFDVRIESFVSLHGTRPQLFKRLLLELIKLLIIKGSIKNIKLWWNRFKNPIISGPGFDFPWAEPDFERIKQIIKDNYYLMTSDLKKKWSIVTVAHYEMYSNHEQLKSMADFIITVKDLTDKVQVYLEKKYPSLLTKVFNLD
jgi:hypothetical protein